MPLPSPAELFARFEAGEIDRAELHVLMAGHARNLIAEMEEDYQNPLGAWWEGVLARKAMGRLTARHGAKLVREVLGALAEADFPAAGWLWNADHPDVPLHCFLRMKRRPVFRLLSLQTQGSDVLAKVETSIDQGDAVARRSFLLVRDGKWRLRCDGKHC